MEQGIILCIYAADKALQMQLVHTIVLDLCRGEARQAFGNRRDVGKKQGIETRLTKSNKT